MKPPRPLLDILRSKTGSDDLLRTLLKAQAAHSQTAVKPITDDTAIRVVALNKVEQPKR